MASTNKISKVLSTEHNPKHKTRSSVHSKTENGRFIKSKLEEISSKTSEEKIEWLFQGPKSELGQELRVCATQARFHFMVSNGLLKAWTTGHVTKERTGDLGLINGQIVEERWGEREERGGWRIIWFDRNLFASRSCGYPCGCPREGTIDWQPNKDVDDLTKGDIGVECLVRITSSLHQVETKNNSEEKPTTHKGPFILWTFLFHTYFTWWNVRPSTCISIGSFWFLSTFS